MYAFLILGELLKKYVNDKIYYNIGNQSPISDPYDEVITGDDFIAVLPPGHYNEQEFCALLNNVLHSQNNSLSCSFDDITKQFSITLDHATAWTTRFRIFTDYEVRFHIHVKPYGDIYEVKDAEHPQSINEIIRNTGQYSHIYQNNDNSYTCDRLVLNTVNNVYITNPHLGSFETIAFSLIMLLKKFLCLLAMDIW